VAGSKDTLKALMISMIFGAAMSGFLSTYVVVTFLRDYQVHPGLIASLQVIQQASLLMGLPGAVLLSNLNPKNCTIFCILLGRLPLIALPVMLLVPGCSSIVPVVTVMLLGIMGLVGSAAGGPTNAWFKQVIPAPVQGRYLGKRNAVSFGVMALLTPLIGYVLDHDGKFPCGRNVLYASLFSMAFILGMLDLCYLMKAGDVTSPLKRSRSELWQEIVRVFQTGGLWRVSLLSGLPVLGITILLPYLVLIFYDFQLSRFQTGVIMAISTLGQGAGAIIGGKYADKNRGRSGNIFSVISFGIASMQMVVLGMFLGRGYAVISVDLLFVGLLVVMSVMSILQGVELSAYTRLVLDSVPDGSTIAFGFISFAGSVFAFVISFISSAIGVMLISWTPQLRKAIWPEFHYAYGLLFLAIVVGGVGGIVVRYLVRGDLCIWATAINYSNGSGASGWFKREEKNVEHSTLNVQR
jgi:MFS family permease